MSQEEQANAERFDLVQESGQGWLDTLISNQTLEHIPIVKTFTALIKAVSTVRDAIVIQKISAFLTAFPDVSVAQRLEMIQRLESDRGYDRKVGLHLVELLDRIDSHRKPVIVGQIFAAFARGSIDLQALHRLIAGVERLPSHDIDAVRVVERAIAEPHGVADVNSEITYSMINAGFVYVESGYGGGAAKVTPTCSLFLKLNLDRMPISK